MKLRLLISSLVMLVAISSTTGCDEQNDPVEKTQEVYFEVSYLNNAWVPQFRGFFINRDGQVMLFDKPAKWNDHESAGLTAQQLAENLSQITLSTVKILPEEFSNYAKMVLAIGNSDISKPVQIGADGGVTSFYAYVLDADRLIYKPIFLKQTGDIQIQNNDKAAIEIAAWLNQIVEQVY